VHFSCASVTTGYLFFFVIGRVLTRLEKTRLSSLFLTPPEEGLDLVTNKQGTIYSASTESPGPDWKPGSGFI